MCRALKDTSRAYPSRLERWEALLWAMYGVHTQRTYVEIYMNLSTSALLDNCVKGAPGVVGINDVFPLLFVLVEAP